MKAIKIPRKRNENTGAAGLAAVAAGFVVCSISYAVFLFVRLADPVVRNDIFRGIPKALPFYQGERLAPLTDENALFDFLHRFCIDVFGGDFRYSAIVVFVAAAAFLILLAAKYSKETSLAEKTLMAFLGAFFLVPTNLVDYQWPLVPVAYVSYSVFIWGFAILIDTALSSPSRRTIAAVLIFALALLLFWGSVHNNCRGRYRNCGRLFCSEAPSIYCGGDGCSHSG